MHIINHRLEDKIVHDIIDKSNPSLRAKDNIDSKEKKENFLKCLLKMHMIYYIV